jgi:hypothetical protein
MGQALKGLQHLVTGDRASRMNNQTLARVLIDPCQHLHRSTVDSPIHNEIPRPDVARIRRLHGIVHRRVRPSFSFTHRLHAKPFLSPHALDAFAIDRPAFSAQQLMNKTIAPTRVLFRQGDNPLLQTLPSIGGVSGRIIITRRCQIDYATRPSSRAQAQLSDLLDGSFFVRRAPHFFELISFNTRISSIASARIFFNSALSFSKLFNRLASDTSMPPYCFFQR